MITMFRVNHWYEVMEHVIMTCAYCGKSSYIKDYKHTASNTNGYEIECPKCGKDSKLQFQLLKKE